MSASNYAVTYSQFVTDFKEFKNQPWADETTVNYWSAIAFFMINAKLYGGGGSPLYTLAAELFVAHHVVIEALENGTIQADGLPGINTGAVSSESFGSMSVSYATGDVLEERAGHWNYTRYGTRFLKMGKEFGAGPQSINPSGPGPGVTAWGGPPYWPWG